jgi:uncharacterized membrane protein
MLDGWITGCYNSVSTATVTNIKWHKWVNMFGGIKKIKKRAIVAYFMILPSFCLKRLRKP